MLLWDRCLVLFISRRRLDNGIIYIEKRSYQEKFKRNEYDVVIVGGGITGAGIALDASNRGMKVALVEMQDFAQGTSSRSTKLVHGGLRYLKQLQVGVVAETGKERNCL